MQGQVIQWTVDIMYEFLLKSEEKKEFFKKVECFTIQY